jgi:hypothetical protein
MSIVSVHGPYTFGSKGVVEAGPVMAEVDDANGLIWTFDLDGPTTRVAADFDWVYSPAGGTPATPIADDAPPLTITFTTAGTKTVTLTVSGAGAGATPYPPAGTYVITVNAVSGVPPRMVEEEKIEEVEEESAPALAEEEEFDPTDYTVTEVISFVEDNPETLEDVLALEREGKARTTLISHLEGMREA